MQLFKSLSLILILCMPIGMARALELALSEQQLNNLLQLSFPMQQHYQGYQLTFSEPNVQLGSGQQVTVKSYVLAQQQGQKLHASIAIAGQVHYNASDKVVEIIKPALTEFRILDNSISQSDQVIQTIKQAVGQQLPLIFLLDMQQINRLLPGIQPRAIEVRDGKLVLVL